MKNYKYKLRELFKINPHKQWMFLLNVFFILTFILIITSFFILYKIKKEEIFQSNTEKEESKPLINEVKLKNALDILNNKNINNNKNTEIVPHLNN